MINFESCTVLRKKTRNSRIAIKHTGEVVISIPRFSLPSYAQRIFESKKDWIEKKLNEIRKHSSLFEERKWEILYLWDFYRFIHDEKISKDIIDKENKIISSKHNLLEKNILLLWLKKEANDFLKKRLEDIVKIHDFKVGKVSIRNQKTRWWSCSGKNNISLNLRLIKCPIHAIDYVIYHELVHTIEKNHSERFWTKLESYNKDCKTTRKWLKKNSWPMFL